jgi:hypothetical protein
MNLDFKVFVITHLLVLLGGVLGRNPFSLRPLPKFLVSAALRIEKLHIKLSSTAIRAPELSNSPQ